MQQISTPELLVKHLYNETDVNEYNLAENVLENDTNLQQEFAKMQETKNALDDADGNEPSQSVINNILDFSKRTATELV